MDPLTLINADCLTALRTLPAESVQCCVTSPPYWGLRDYKNPPTVWGGKNDCRHAWIDEGRSREKADRSTEGKDANGSGMFGEHRGVQGSKVARGESLHFGATCATCGAWRGGLGLEPTAEMFIEHIVEIFREVRRTMTDDGTLWLNLGDSNSDSGKGGTPGGSQHIKQKSNEGSLGVRDRKQQTQLPPKNLLMIPARVAIALQADGWILRSMIPWIKRNCMPESVNDRPTKATEYVFLFSKSQRYYYDKTAVMIAASKNSHARLAQDVEAQIGSERANGGGKTNGNMKAVCGKAPHGSIEARKARAREGTKSYPADGRNGIRGKTVEPGNGIKNNSSMAAALACQVLARNRRDSDWLLESWQGILADDDGDPLALIVNPMPYKGAHFATFPPKLVEPMIAASTAPGDVVLDPFGGSGTTGAVAIGMGRRAVLIELNPDYCTLIRQRCETTIGLPLA